MDSRRLLRPAIAVPEAIPLLEEVVACRVRLRDDEREALEVVLAEARERHGLDQVCPTCAAERGRPCRTIHGETTGVSHSSRRTHHLFASKVPT